MNIPTKVTGYVTWKGTGIRQNVLLCSVNILFTSQGLNRLLRLSNHKPYSVCVWQAEIGVSEFSVNKNDDFINIC